MKTKQQKIDEAYEVYKAITDPALAAYKAITDPAGAAYKAITDPACEAYEAIRDTAEAAYKAKCREIDAEEPITLAEAEKLLGKKIVTNTPT